MANRIDNIESLLDNLVSDASYSLNSDITYQLKYMESQKYNDDFDKIYERLNRLYEKTRLLYELSDNIEYYLKENINEINSKINEIIRSIEAQRDTLKHSSDTVINVNFNNQYNTDFIDRDGTAIDNKAYIKDSVLTLPPITSNEIKINEDNISVNTYDQYKIYNLAQYNSLNINGTYRTIYVSTSPIDIKEKVTITFSEPIKMNQLSLKLSNSDFDNLYYITEDARILVKDISSTLATKYIKGIEFDIYCLIPKIEIFTVPTTTNTDSYLHINKPDDYANLFFSAVNEFTQNKNEYDIMANKYYTDNNTTSTYSSYNLSGTSKIVLNENDFRSDTGYWNDDQSLERHSNDPESYEQKNGAYIYGNQYPTIETATIYGKKSL